MKSMSIDNRSVCGKISYFFLLKVLCKIQTPSHLNTKNPSNNLTLKLLVALLVVKLIGYEL